MGDGEVRIVEQRLPFAPGVEARHLVGADHQDQRSRGAEARAQRAQRVDRVARPAALDLAHVERQAAFARDRQRHHVRALRGIGDRALLPGLRGGDQANFGEAEPVACIARQLQMADVDRIEAAAEEPDRFDVG
ncbi:MAG: hypothetical protein U5L03_07615 [Burkholderiaceae bacterium]|nr:hypothetical protein [Burkholderiaceae bacterium]